MRGLTKSELCVALKFLIEAQGEFVPHPSDAREQWEAIKLGDAISKLEKIYHSMPKD